MYVLKPLSRTDDGFPYWVQASHFSGIRWPLSTCELDNGKVLVVLFLVESHCCFLVPTQVTLIAAAQTAHPWGALSHSPLTPLNKTAQPSLLPASPGRNLEGFLGLYPHHLPMDRKALDSGQLVLNQVLKRMQPKQMQNQIVKVLPPSPAQGMFPHP